MAQPRPWLDEIIDALRELGGEAVLDDIYYQVKCRKRMNFSANKNWKARIRGTLETHSSDSMAYDSINRDCFRSVNGIGQGDGPCEKVYEIVNATVI